MIVVVIDLKIVGEALGVFVIASIILDSFQHTGNDAVSRLLDLGAGIVLDL